MTLEKVCDYCLEKFVAKGWQARKRRFCTPTCKARFHDEKQARIAAKHEGFGCEAVAETDDVRG